MSRRIAVTRGGILPLQEPYPARWYWNVTMGYVALVSGAKVMACFLQSRICDAIWSADTWVCASLIPAW